MRFERGKDSISGLVHCDLAVLQRQRILLLAVALLPASFLCACGGVTTQSTQTTPPPPTYSISGTISPVAGGSGATASLSGAASATTTANSSGNFTFTGLANGAYTVTPSEAGYIYNPTSQNATINGSNVSGINFTATAQTTHSVAITWVASTSVVVGYNVYRSISGGSYTRLNGSLVAGLSYTDSNVPSGDYVYVATAVDSSGNESVYSLPASAHVP